MPIIYFETTLIHSFSLVISTLCDFAEKRFKTFLKSSLIYKLNYVGYVGRLNYYIATLSLSHCTCKKSVILTHQRRAEGKKFQCMQAWKCIIRLIAKNFAASHTFAFEQRDLHTYFICRMLKKSFSALIVHIIYAQFPSCICAQN